MVEKDVRDQMTLEQVQEENDALREKLIELKERLAAKECPQMDPLRERVGTLKVKLHASELNNTKLIKELGDAKRAVARQDLLVEHYRFRAHAVGPLVLKVNPKQSAKSFYELRERLAVRARDAWCSWMSYEACSWSELEEEQRERWQSVVVRVLAELWSVGTTCEQLMAHLNWEQGDGT
jgi:hypothetical protein